MFDESKAWILIFITAALIGIGYGAHYLTSVDNANAAYLESKSKLAAMDEVLVQRKKVWEATEKLINKNRELAEQYNILVQAKDVLDKRFRAVDSDIKYAVDSMKSSVARVRENAPGSELGDITLTDGKVMQGAKIRKIEESSISLIHSNGIGSVSLDLLPEEILQRFDMGSNAILPQLEAVRASFEAKPEAGTAAKPQVAATKPRTTTTTSAPETSVDESKAKAIKLKLATLSARIDTYTESVVRYRKIAEQHQQLATEAKNGGKPSTRYSNDASSAFAQAQQMENQLNAMREERSKLEVELEYAQRAR